jgi:hypothetical protein
MSNKVKTDKKDEDILASLPEDLANDIKEMSETAGTSVKNLLATLVWMGKRSFGREVVITSDEEKDRLRVTALKKFLKLTPLGKK